MVLVGDSWGASLAAHYIAVHPERVERAIFTSPGAIDHRDWDPPLVTPGFSPAMLEWVRTSRSREEYRRYLLLDSLLQRRDVRTAYARFGDAEMDPVLDAWITGEILEGTVHDPAKVRDERMRGMGWWVQTMTAWDALSTAPAVRDKLARFERPVLILHGTSDYLPAGMSEQYASAFPNARIVHIPDCGHLIWLERSDVYGAEILGFLRELVVEGAPPVR
jgi:proline iminopeptidase